MCPGTPGLMSRRACKYLSEYTVFPCCSPVMILQKMHCAFCASSCCCISGVMSAMGMYEWLLV